MICAASSLRRVPVVPIIVLLSSILFAAGTVFGADNYSLWANSTNITLNTNAAGVTTTQNNFPIVIKLVRGSNFTGFASVKLHGEDIRFANSAGTHLPYQIERWDSAAGLAEVWVKVDQIIGGNSTQYIKMLWGNSNAADSSSGSTVFSSGFLGVYHLSSNNFTDATSNGLNGTNTATTDTVGIIGVAKKFNGSAYITIPSTNFGNSFTISAWMKPSTAVANIITLAANKVSGATVGNGFAYFVNTYPTTDGTITFENDNGTARTAAKSGAGQVTYSDPTSWYYLTVTVDRTGGIATFYKNAANATSTSNVQTNFANTGGWCIGAFTGNTLYPLNGYMDEVVVSSSVRTADWIKLSYENQKPGQSLPTICPLPTITAQPSNQSNVPVGQSATFTVAATGTSLSYQWQYSTDGTIWSNAVSGTPTQPTYSFTTDLSQNNYKYRCQVTGNSCSVVASTPATLTVCTPPVVSNPKDSSVIAGNPVSFSVTATGSGTLTYQWQNSPDGSSWVPVSGATSATYVLTNAPYANNGYQYRCVVSNGCGSPATSGTALLTVCQPPSTTNPANQSNVVVGGTATFSVTGSGSAPLSYQWQDSAGGITSWTAITSATGSSYSRTNVQASDSGKQFRCVVSNGCGNSAYSSAAILTVCTPPKITANPVSQSDTAGHSASFSVAASGSPSLVFQWQRSTDGGSGWTDIAAATNPTYSFTPASGQDGWKFRCRVSSTSSCGSSPVFSSAATMSVCTSPSITTQPVSLPSKQVGDSAKFTVVIGAQVSSASLQWQRSPDGSSWTKATDGTGATSATWAFLVTAADTGAKFRCSITNGCGALNSNIVTISGCTPASLTNPTDQNATAGTQATFSVSGSGTGTLLYQWQDSINAWANVATGGTTPTDSFTALSTMSGRKYRCIVTGNCGVPDTSASALLTVCTPPTTFSSQPASQTKMVGDNIVFSVTLPADVSNPQYQWQRSPDGATWTNAAGTSATMPSCTLTVVAGDNGAKFRCMVTNTCGMDSSNVATLTLCTQPVITTPPANLNAVATKPASFTVAATGSGTLSYQWEYSVNGGGTWSPVASDGNAATYGFTAASNQTGWQFHCIVSNGCGTAAVSSSATMTVCTMPALVLQPVSLDRNIGDAAVFTISATGSSLTYQWQRSPDGTAWSGVTAGTGGTTVSYSLTAAAADNGAKFRCMVQNGCGKDSSAAATLVVCLPPRITSQPRDTGVIAGQIASFGTACTGTTVAYQWQRSNNSLNWTDLANQKNPSYSLTTVSADNGAKFRCVITTKCGDTMTSVAALAVCTPAGLDSQFVTNKSVLTGESVSFRVVAHGSGVTYSWQKKTNGASAFTNITNPGAAYSFATQISDSASLYRCIVSGQCGAPETTQTAQVLVYMPLRAAFSVSATNGQAPLTVQFFDSSTGSFTTRIWDFGDGSKPDSATQNPTHTYVLANTYTARLTVSGPLPRIASSAQTQVLTWNPGGNTMQITGTFLPPQKVAYVITNYNSIVPPSPLVAVDSVVLWYKSGGMPQTAAASTYLKGYTLAALKTRGGQYADTVAMPSLAAGDSVYGFMTSILWSDGKRSTFGAGNGTVVLMKDTTPVLNQIIISGAYAPNDTARIFLDNVSSIDTSRVDSVGIWYSLAGSTVNFKDAAATRWVTARSVVAAGTKYAFTIVNSQFNNEKRTMYAAVVLVGTNDRQSPVKQTSFSVGKDRPTNPVKLVAKALSANRIRLSWNNVASTGVERLVIWYRTGQPVPKSYDFSSIKLDSLVPSVGDTVIIGDKFTEKTKYYFGAQVYKNGLWSNVTDSSSAADSTGEAGSKLDSNSCAVTRLYLDTLTNQIRVCWSVDAAQAESLQVGVLYSTVRVPVIDSGNQQAVDVKAAQDSAYIKLHENLQFNTTYYVSLWLRRVGGKWTDPTSRAVDSVAVRQFTWQSVTYFSKDKDTVFSFNNEVRLINMPGDQSRTVNTVVYTPAAGAAAAAFVPVSIGIDFRVKDPGVPLYIGLKVDSVPQGYTLVDVRIYRRTASGLWIIDENPLTYDSIGMYVSAFTNQIGQPFFAMVDTRSPSEKVVSTITRAIDPDVGYSDTIELSDNIANLRWHFLSAKGDAAYASGDTSQSGALSDTTGTVIVTIPGGNVSQDNGVRAVLIVSDGVHVDTVELWRSVARSSLGVLRTEELEWTPLSTAFVLDTTEMRNALAMYASDDGSWNYDTKYFRVFRWSSGTADDGSWMEYADSLRDRFEFVRGNLVWIKTKEKAEIEFGSGRTPSLSLKDPFKVALAPKSWTDFSLPYKFNIAIGDILNATKSGHGETDSLAFYIWKKDDKGSFHTEAVFIKAISDTSLNNEAAALVSEDLSGFTVFNAYDDTVLLRIPPLPQAMSTAGLSKRSLKRAKTVASDAWAIRIASRLSDSTVLSPVYCGYSKNASGGTSYYPAAPSFAMARVGVFDAGLKKTLGHAVAHATVSGGCAFLLSFSNESDRPEKVSYRLENLSALPPGSSAAVFNSATQQFEDAAGGTSGGATVTLDAHSTGFRWLLVGTQDYLAKAARIARPAMLALIGTYPNPFRTMVRIRYNLPYEGVDKVKFMIFDVRGRSVWHSEVACGSKYGPSEMTWNTKSGDGRPVAAGVYILKMTAMSGTKKVVGAFERKMTFVP